MLDRLNRYLALIGPVLEAILPEDSWKAQRLRLEARSTRRVAFRALLLVVLGDCVYLSESGLWIQQPLAKTKRKKHGHKKLCNRRLCMECGAPPRTNRSPGFSMHRPEHAYCCV